MSATNNPTGSRTGSGLPAPWQILLDWVEQDAKAIADEIMADSVLADSIMQVISGYLVQHDKLSAIRKEFAEADTFCANLRSEAKELMASLGFDFDWDTEDVGAVDAQLVQGMREAAERASAINKLRAEASKEETRLLERAVDEIALCASIVVLRQMNRYTCEGEAFCAAYIAALALREKTIGDMPANKATATLSSWLQGSINVKTRGAECDIYARSRVAATIGKGMGIDNSGALRLALIEAMKKSSARKSG